MRAYEEKYKALDPELQNRKSMKKGSAEPVLDATTGDEKLGVKDAAESERIRTDSKEEEEDVILPDRWLEYSDGVEEYRYENRKGQLTLYDIIVTCLKRRGYEDISTPLGEEELKLDWDSRTVEQRPFTENTEIPQKLGKQEIMGACILILKYTDRDLILVRNALIPRKHAEVWSHKKAEVHYGHEDAEPMVLYLKKHKNPGLYHCYRVVQGGLEEIYTYDGELVYLSETFERAPEGEVTGFATTGAELQLKQPYKDLFANRKPENNMGGPDGRGEIIMIKKINTGLKLRAELQNGNEEGTPFTGAFKEVPDMCWFFISELVKFYSSKNNKTLPRPRRDLQIEFCEEPGDDWYCGNGLFWRSLDKSPDRIQLCFKKKNTSLPEDVMHEFLHAVASNWYKGNLDMERNALEEAFCEYCWRVMIISKSHRISNINLWPEREQFEAVTYMEVTENLNSAILKWREEKAKTVFSEAEREQRLSEARRLSSGAEHYAGNFYLYRLRKLRESCGVSTSDFDLKVYKSFCGSLKDQAALDKAAMKLISDLGLEASQDAIKAMGDLLRQGITPQNTFLARFKTRVSKRFQATQFSE